MDNYLERILSRQQRESAETQSQGVLKRLSEEIGISAGGETEPVSAAGQRNDAEQFPVTALRQNEALSQLAAQLSETVWKETKVGRIVSGSEKNGEGSGWEHHGVVPVERQREVIREWDNLSMDALSMYFERDARRYPG